MGQPTTPGTGTDEGVAHVRAGMLTIQPVAEPCEAERECSAMLAAWSNASAMTRVVKRRRRGTFVPIACSDRVTDP
jgi:hypothetical protein